MISADISFTIDTPMFIGGAQIGGAEFRLPSLRGAMRFWFRAFAGPLFGNDIATVATAESALFGSARGRGKPSSILLRPISSPRQSAPQDPPTPAWLANGRWIGYMLGPGLFKPPDAVSRESLAVDTPGSFALMSSSPDKARLAAMCLWALGTYGGLGLRCHRGFGGISFTGLDRLWPDMPAQTRLVDLDKVRAEFVDLATSCLGLATRVAPNAYPAFPSFSNWFCKLSDHDYPTWHAALNAAGENLRTFRASVDRTQPPYSRADLEGDRYHQYVTPEYAKVVFPQPPRVDNLHPQQPPRARPKAATFELGAFGLPIVFAHAATVTINLGGKEIRRASPLWVRPWRSPNARWKLAYHVFEAELWPAAASLDLTIDGGRQDVDLSLSETAAYQKLRAWTAQAP